MADRTLPGLGLKGFWALGEGGWNADMDINLLKLSVLVGGSALDLVSADPGAPADGDIHLLTDTHPTNPGEIAVRDAGAWVYFAAPVGCVMYDVATSQHRFFDGTTWAVLAVAGGGGGSSGVIGGVTLDGVTQIGNAALVATDSEFVAVSFWIRYHADADVRQAISYANDPANEYGIWHANWSGGPNDGKLACVFEDEDSFAFERVVGPALTPSAQWLHYLIVFKGESDGTHNNQIVVYQNRELLALTYTGVGAASFVPTLNGKAFYVGSDSYGDAAAFDMAEFWLQTGVDFLEVDGTISDATLNKFIDADLKPVPLGANGETPTGTAPVIFMHRDAGEDASTFTTNLGTGGDFVVSAGVPTDPVDNPGD